MRKYINILSSLLCGLLFVATSCSSEYFEPAERCEFECQLNLQADAPSFSALRTRASSTEWNDGDVIYMYIPSEGLYGYAVYSSDVEKWDAYFSGKPADTSSGTIIVRYFEGAVHEASNINLSYQNILYSDSSAKYSFTSADGMSLTANISPDFGRIRFKGEVGKTIKVTGLRYRSMYTRSSDTFSTNTAELTLTVGENGYTDYVYGDFANASRMLTLHTDDIIYTTYCSSGMYNAGQSGIVTIPLESAHSGWNITDVSKFDTSAIVDVDGDFSAEENWDKSSTHSGNISVDDFSAEESWDKSSTHSGNISVDDFSAEESWDKSSTHSGSISVDDFSAEESWDKSSTHSGSISVDDFSAEENWDKSSTHSGSIYVGDFSAEENWDKSSTDSGSIYVDDFNNDECWDSKISQTASISLNDFEPDEIWDVVDEQNASKRTYTANGVSFNMILVEHGTFTMGATAEQISDSYDVEKPTHQVTLTNDYYIGETEVTQALWKAVTGYTPTSDGSSWSSIYGKGDNYPAYYISYNDVLSFITKLNSLTGKTFRMPTEAEWEFAARGGNKSNGYKYSGSNTIEDVAWYMNNSKYTTHQVMTKAPNELGIYDMSGNVCEWCSDWDGVYSSSSQTNPTGPSSGSNRVYRGGSWFSDARYCRTSSRDYDAPKDRYDYHGFRLVLSR